MAADKEKSTPAKKSLGKASESANITVHVLLAEKQAATQNGDKKAADAATAQLAELGYE